MEHHPSSDLHLDVQPVSLAGAHCIVLQIHDVLSAVYLHLHNALLIVVHKVHLPPFESSAWKKVAGQWVEEVGQVVQVLVVILGLTCPGGH